MVNAGAASMEVPTSDHSNQHGRVSPDHIVSTVNIMKAVPAIEGSYRH